MLIKSVGAAVALALLSTTAMAADLPSRRAPPVYVPPPLPVFSWTGLYIGAHAGYEFGSSQTSSTVGFGSANPSGFIGGGHIGYNYQFGNFGGLGSGLVLGVEGDVDGSNYKSGYFAGPMFTSASQDIQGSARGRLGIAVDRVLFYATGGAAFGGLNNQYFAPAGFATVDRSKVGWTAGAGVEYAITNNWSARVEYRYTDFGTSTDFIPGGFAQRKETDNRVQAGVSYKFDVFNPIAPVVARY